jgi:hypothetical protein
VLICQPSVLTGFLPDIESAIRSKWFKDDDIYSDLMKNAGHSEVIMRSA